MRFSDSSDPTALVSPSLISDFSFSVLIYVAETKRQRFIFSRGFNLSWQGSCDRKTQFTVTRACSQWLFRSQQIGTVSARLLVTHSLQLGPTS